MQEYKNRLKALRKAKGLSQEKLAELLNVSQATISLYEQNGNIPNQILITIAEMFGVTTDYLLGMPASCENISGVAWDSTAFPKNGCRLKTLCTGLSINQRQVAEAMLTVIHKITF